MSDTAKSQDDLSIEEILGSIRRIIAEDDEDTAQPVTAAAAPKAETLAVQDAEPETYADIAFDDEDEEPLELTDKIEIQEHDTASEAPESDFAVVLQEEMDKDVAVDIVEPEAEKPAVVEEFIEPVAAPIAAVKEEKPAMTNAQDDASLKDNALLSSNAAIATAAVMAKLARQAAITEEGNGNVTLEAMVKEMIRPMLREWLDANLPDLVQKMVERELERLTKRL